MPYMPSQDKRAAVTLAKLAACALCLLIFVATLDTIPDPPALAPQAIQQTLAARLDHSPSTPPAKTLPIFAPRAFHSPNAPTTAFLAPLRPENATSSPLDTLLRHASDASPPASS
jgi:hypothetical protein